MALEALNDAGFSKSKMTVILNDNEMSISPNVGGLNKFLGKLRTKKLYTRTNNLIKKHLTAIPVIGKPTVKVIQKIKRAIKQLVIQRMFFEDIGFTYFGPVDGHNIEKLESVLKMSEQVNGPVLIHILTTKGKGYEITEKNPDKFHATSPFDIKTGELKKKKSKDYSKVFGDKLVELAKNNEKIVAITASMKDGTGLKEFALKYPERFFDVGIAEQHALTFAAGLAKEGMIPFVPIYSSFYQRAYDQVIHDICMQNLPVIMCVDRAGIVGKDGETHQGILDLSFFNLVPNLVIMAPKDFKELEQMMEYAITLNKPIVIRYPRGRESNLKISTNSQIKIGKSEILKKGNDVTIIGIGKTVSKAMEIEKQLRKYKINAEVINARFLKPLDKYTILKSLNKTKFAITIEDNTLIGGLSSSVKELIIDKRIKNVKVKSFGYPDVYVQHGTPEELEKIYGLDNRSIINYIKYNIKKRKEKCFKRSENN